MSWHGFNPRIAQGGLLIVECLPGAANEGFLVCDKVQTHEYVRIDHPIPRSGSANYTVHSGALNVNGSCGISRKTNNCVILVVALDRHGDFIGGFGVEVPITFDLSQTTPHVTADPTSALTDKQSVHLVGTNYSPSQEEDIFECNRHTQKYGVHACTDTAMSVSGNFDVQFEVRQGRIGADYGGPCGTTTSNNACVIAIAPSVYNEGLVFGDAILIPITFSLPSS